MVCISKNSTPPTLIIKTTYIDAGPCQTTAPHLRYPLRERRSPENGKIMIPRGTGTGEPTYDRRPRHSNSKLQRHITPPIQSRSEKTPALLKNCTKQHHSTSGCPDPHGTPAVGRLPTQDPAETGRRVLVLPDTTADDPLPRPPTPY